MCAFFSFPRHFPTSIRVAFSRFPFHFFFHYSWAGSLFSQYAFLLLFSSCSSVRVMDVAGRWKSRRKKNKPIISSHARVNGLSFTSLPPADSYHLSEEFSLALGWWLFCSDPFFHSFCFSCMRAYALKWWFEVVSCQELGSHFFLPLRAPLRAGSFTSVNIIWTTCMYSNLKKDPIPMSQETHSAQGNI